MTVVYKYSDGIEVNLNDKVKMGQDIGWVVCICETNEVSDRHTDSDWTYMDEGFMCWFKEIGHVQMTDTNTLELVERDAIPLTDTVDELIKDKNFNEAITLCLNYLKIHPKDWKIHRSLSKAYEKVKNYPLAINSSSEVINLKPFNISGEYMSRGRLLIKSKLALEAIEDFSKVIADQKDQDYKPYLESAYFLRSLMYIVKRKYSEAYSDIQRVEEDCDEWVMGGLRTKQFVLDKLKLEGIDV